MPKVLTTDSTVSCGHGANASLSSTAKLTVGGSNVLLANGYSAWSFPPGCSQTNVDSGEKICTLVTGITAGESSKLSVGGQAVLLESLGGTTDGSPDSLSLGATANQNKLEAV